MIANRFQKWKIITVTVLVVFICVTVFILLPYGIRIVDKYALYNNQKAQISLIGNWQDRLFQYESTQAQVQSDIESMIMLLASEKESSLVIEDILSYARGSMVNIHKFQPIIENTDVNHIKRSLRLQITGEYNNTATFINKLEQGKYMIIIKKYIGERTQYEKELASYIDIEITLLKNNYEKTY